MQDWYVPDVARAIAKAINEGDGGRPVIRNEQQLDNGIFGTASPLPAVHARALGGLSGIIDAPLNTIVGDRALFLEEFADVDFNLVDELGTNALSDREVERLLTGPFNEINQGLELFARRNDGCLVHDQRWWPTANHDQHGEPGYRPRSRPNDVAFQHLDGRRYDRKVRRHQECGVDRWQWIDYRRPRSKRKQQLGSTVARDRRSCHRGASPTILNNVFFNVQTPVVNEESRRFPLTGGVAPYGSNNPNEILKPGEVVIGGSIYQYVEPGVANVRFGTGIEQTPTNVPNTALDLNLRLPMMSGCLSTLKPVVTCPLRARR